MHRARRHRLHRTDCLAGNGVLAAGSKMHKWSLLYCSCDRLMGTSRGGGLVRVSLFNANLMVVRCSMRPPWQLRLRFVHPKTSRNLSPSLVHPLSLLPSSSRVVGARPERGCNCTRLSTAFMGTIRNGIAARSCLSARAVERRVSTRGPSSEEQGKVVSVLHWRTPGWPGRTDG